MLVYQKVLEFYQVAHEILTKRGAKLVMSMVLETDRLPNVVRDFSKHANALHKLIENATLQMVVDIKNMVYDYDSKFPMLLREIFVLIQQQSTGG